MRKFVLGIAALATVGAALPASAQSINQRAHRQEQRTQQGERSGTLTRAEARRLQYLETRLHRTEARLRWENGGRLTRGERYRLLRMERQDSHAIYRLKHNLAVS